mmetsp:Transcript_22584/g.22860  ORF Transcript_22584/g.22860 Transcript_22584/m.22860 type:complete len:123 (-) Transcript_22584:1483-1851(-)
MIASSGAGTAWSGENPLLDITISFHLFLKKGRDSLVSTNHWRWRTKQNAIWIRVSRPINDWVAKKRSNQYRTNRAAAIDTPAQRSVLFFRSVKMAAVRTEGIQELLYRFVCRRGSWIVDCGL